MQQTLLLALLAGLGLAGGGIALFLRYRKRGKGSRGQEAETPYYGRQPDYTFFTQKK